MAQHLDLAAADVRVLGALGAPADLAGDPHAELVADPLGHLEHVGAIGIADHLGQALAVAQVDEDDAAVVAAAVDPAEEGDHLVELVGGNLAGVAAAHRKFSVQARGSVTTPRSAGATTPIETTYLSASSTLMFSSIVSARGTIRKKPDVGLGVVGT